MNWVVGLKRATALVCGGVGLLLVAVAIGENIARRPGEAIVFTLVSIIGSFGTYKAVCWLIDGFAGDSKA